MKRGRFTRVAALTALLGLFTACSNIEQLYDRDERVPVEELPAEVVAAAEKAVPKIAITRAEREKREGEWVYDLSGTTEGFKHEIRVAHDGKIINVATRSSSNDDD